MLNHLGSFCVRLVRGRYNLLLICLSLLFIFRPYSSNLVYLAVWKLLLTGVILSAIFDCKNSKGVKIAESILAIPTVLLCWLVLWHDLPWVSILNAGLSMLFTFLCTLSIIHDVLVQRKVTFEILRGVICAYLLAAIGFAYLFWFIEFFDPGTFSILNKELSVYSYADYLSEMLYFSFVTFLTIGYGDIVPVKEMGQTAIVIEGIFGQFYVAILVSRLVSIYSIASHMELLHLLENKKNKSKATSKKNLNIPLK